MRYRSGLDTCVLYEVGGFVVGLINVQSNIGGVVEILFLISKT